MWKNFGMVLVVYVAVVKANQSTVLPLNLTSTEHYINDTDSCYIKELNTTLKVGDKTPSKTECVSYLCTDKGMVVQGCNHVETPTPPCNITEEKHFPHPKCCPKIECTVSNFSRAIKKLQVLGTDFRDEDEHHTNKNKPKHSEKKEKNKPKKNKEKGQSHSDCDEKSEQAKKTDKVKLSVLKVDLLGRQDNETLHQDTQQDGPSPSSDTKPDEDDIPIPDDAEPDEHDKEVEEETKQNGKQAKMTAIKTLSVLGVNMLENGPIPIDIWGQATTVKCKPKETETDKQQELERLRQAEVLLYFKRANA